MQQLTAAQLKVWLEDAARGRPILLDVREPWEVQICRIPDSVHMPMRERCTLPERFKLGSSSARPCGRRSRPASSAWRAAA